MNSHEVHYNKKDDFAKAENWPEERKARNIIVLMDGTWNDENGKDEKQPVQRLVSRRLASSHKGIHRRRFSSLH